MSRKPKIPPEEKIAAVEAYLHGELGTTEAVQKYKISTATWRTWRMLYTTRGPEGLMPQSQNRKYSPAFKENVVKEYLEGNNSLLGLCKKYSISSHGMVQSWIKRYNGQKDFRKSNHGSETCMTKGRVTTLDERIEIISYCIENGKDYGKAVEKYHVSYQQIYNWVKKHEESGVNGLIDRRGKRKPLEEMTDVERLRAELKILESENKQKEMEIEILKKVQEVERRRG